MRSAWVHVCGIVALMALSSLPASGAAGNATLHVVSFGAVHGEITDCGCKSDKKGGFDLRAGVIDSLHNEGVALLHLDAGDFFSTQEFGADELSRFLWEAMKKTEVDAVTPGARELGNWSLFQELMADDVIPVVTTNLTRVQDGVEAPIGQRHVVLERAGVKIGILGLISGRQYTSVQFPEGVDVRFYDPLTEARKEILALEGQADLIVLLSQMPAADTNAILKQIPEIDLAILGNLPAYNEAPETVGDAIVQATGTRGQYLGHLVLTVDPEGKVVGHESKNAKLWDPLPRDLEMAEQIREMLEKVKTITIEARAAAARAAGE